MEHEESRVLALENLNILDTKNDEAFDMIVELASNIFKAPMSAIGFIDRDRQWFKSSVGLGIKSTHRDVAFCNYTIGCSEYFCIEDTEKDNRFCKHPLVVKKPSVKFYVGVPIKVEANHSVGSLCVIDNQARKLKKHELRALIILGKQVEILLSRNRAMADLRSKEKEVAEFVGHLVHDLKNPLTIINGSLSLIKRKNAIKSEGQSCLSRCKRVVKRMTSQLDQLLNVHLKSLRDIDIQVKHESFSITKMFREIIDQMAVLCVGKQRIILEGGDLYWTTDPLILRRILENLISNSLKYGDGTDISIRLLNEQDYLKIQISDQGKGIPQEMRSRIFELGFFGQQKTCQGPTSSHGIGLHFCKRASQLLGGDLVLAKDHEEGALFEVILPRVLEA